MRGQRLIDWLMRERDVDQERWRALLLAAVAVLFGGDAYLAWGQAAGLVVAGVLLTCVLLARNKMHLLEPAIDRRRRAIEAAPEDAA